MSPTVAVLGPGGVGGTVTARLAATGVDVVSVARPETAEVLRARGIEVEAADGTVVRGMPRVVEMLVDPVTLLIVAVKATTLDEALGRISPAAVAGAVVVPLLNGLEHPAAIRAALGPRVAPGSISHFQAHVVEPGRVAQSTPSGLVTAASDELAPAELEAALRPLRSAGFDVAVAGDERVVLWDKGVRLAVLAAATAASGLTVGALRADRGWRPRLVEALDEACRAAVAVGAPLAPAAQWAIIEAMDPALTTSSARDVAAGRPSELDAITGSVLRAAARHGLACPALESLYTEAGGGGS